MLRLLVLFASVYCLYGFKINIIEVAETGIRVEDIILIFCLISLAVNYVMGYTKIISPIIWVLIFVFWSLWALFFGYGNGNSMLAGLLFAVRPLEYVGAFFLGQMFFKSGYNFEKYIVYYVFYALIVSLLIYWGVLNGFSRFSPDRFFANTNGPYELAPILSFAIIYFFKKPNRFFSVCFPVAAILLLYTFSRITIVGCFLSLLGSIKEKLQKTNKIIFLILIFFLIPISIFSFNLEPIQTMGQRISDAFSIETMNNISRLWANRTSVETHSDYINSAYTSESNNEIIKLSGDASALIRVKRWFIIFSSLGNSWGTFLVGFGPSFTALAVDGYYVRVMAETGLIGLCIFIGFIVSVYKYASRKNDYVLKCFLVVLLVTSLFIDIFVASKVMFLFWFYLGYESNQSNIKSIKSN